MGTRTCGLGVEVLPLSFTITLFLNLTLPPLSLSLSLSLLGMDSLVGIHRYREKNMWPGFRIIKNKSEKKIESLFQMQESERDDETETKDGDKKRSRENMEESAYRNIIDKNNGKKSKKIKKGEVGKVSKEEKDAEESDKKSSASLFIVEPAYYWRVQRDYSTIIPKPNVLSFQVMMMIMMMMMMICLHTPFGKLHGQNIFIQQHK
jgi:hypothetical protein